MDVLKRMQADIERLERALDPTRTEREVAMVIREIRVNALPEVRRRDRERCVQYLAYGKVQKWIDLAAEGVELVEGAVRSVLGVLPDTDVSTINTELSKIKTSLAAQGRPKKFIFAK
jgi:hypothetical protein